ncbi:MAG: hypothetical protein HGA78_11295 [Nitrospirales bacterium]|nr:hypothetical protein [Nitrospirales bacterium]
MGYLSHIINDARRDYRVASRQATFYRTDKAAPKAFEATGETFGDEATATTADYKSPSVGRGDPSQGGTPVEMLQPGSYESSSHRPGDVSTKAELSDFGEVSVPVVAKFVSSGASDFNSLPIQDVLRAMQKESRILLRDAELFWMFRRGAPPHFLRILR